MAFKMTVASDNIAVGEMELRYNKVKLRDKKEELEGLKNNKWHGGNPEKNQAEIPKVERAIKRWEGKVKKVEKLLAQARELQGQ